MNIVQMSIQAGLLIIVIVLVRAVALYRLPKTCFLALWGVVAARMLIPFSLESKWSIYNVLRRLRTYMGGGDVPSDMLVYEHIPTLPGNAVEPSEALAVLSYSPFEVLWIGGMAVLFTVFAVLLIRNYWALRTAEPVTDNEYITQWRTNHRLKRPLKIVRSALVTSPASFGVLRPRIILPKAMDADGGEKLQYILAHEYFHIRRFDMLWKLLALCAVCVHWFNPLAWVMLFLLHRDLELSCDEMVLRHFGGTERAAYAHSLIDMAEKSPAFTIMHSYFSKNAVEERIIAVMKYKKSSLWAMVAALVFIICATTAFATNPTKQEREHDTAGTLISVNRSDEDRYTPEQWAEILEKVEAGEILLFDTLEDELAYNQKFRDIDSGLPSGSASQADVPNNEPECPQEADSATGQLRAVNRNDKDKFTPEEWEDILKKVEAGEVMLFDTLEDENAYFQSQKEGALVASLNDVNYPQQTMHIDILEDENIIRKDFGRLIAVRPEDESKFTPEEWAEILEKIEQGEIRWQDEEFDANVVANCGYPVYITDNADFNVEKDLLSFGRNKLGNEGNTYTDLAAGAEMPVGTLTAAEGQTVTVSVVCENSAEIEVGIKKVQESGVAANEKLVVNEANGSASATLSVKESGEYVLYVKNIGTSSTAVCAFSISYFIK